MHRIPARFQLGMNYNIPYLNHLAITMNRTRRPGWERLSKTIFWTAAAPRRRRPKHTKASAIPRRHFARDRSKSWPADLEERDDPARTKWQRKLSRFYLMETDPAMRQIVADADEMPLQSKDASLTMSGTASELQKLTVRLFLRRQHLYLRIHRFLLPAHDTFRHRHRWHLHRFCTFRA